MLAWSLASPCLPHKAYITYILRRLARGAWVRAESRACAAVGRRPQVLEQGRRGSKHVSGAEQSSAVCAPRYVR
jgi:hypothetical protein